VLLVAGNFTTEDGKEVKHTTVNEMVRSGMTCFPKNVVDVWIPSN
jgi:hypothetical protein